MPGVYPHLYGKQLTKPFRKMGHITITGSSMDEVREKLMRIEKSIRVISD
ncbi:MAG: hypothetical protein ACKN86_12875 [Crocinitomicaceae bacterium]